MFQMFILKTFDLKKEHTPLSESVLEEHCKVWEPETLDEIQHVFPKARSMLNRTVH